MLIQLGSRQFNVTSENSWFLYYDNDLLNGFYADLGQEYCFVSEHVSLYKQLAEKAMAEGISGYKFNKGQYDLNDEPHKYVVNTIGNMLVADAISAAYGCE